MLTLSYPATQLRSLGFRTCGTPPSRKSQLSPASIRQQLDRILSHPEFSQADRLKGFLRFIVEETLAGRADQLKEFTIGLEVFGRDGSFDPQNDTIVRVSAGNLRRRLNQYYLTDGQHDPVHLILQKGTYVPIMQPNGNNKATNGSAVERTEDTHTLTVASDPSIAVLPFNNMNSDPNQEPLCDGLTEEIITRLVRVPELLVIARTTTFQYKGQPVDIRRLGRELGVQYFLTGSLRKDTRTMRVTAQLLETATGVHLWAEKYNHTSKGHSTLKMQDEISEKVVAKVTTLILSNRSKGS